MRDEQEMQFADPAWQPGDPQSIPQPSREEQNETAPSAGVSPTQQHPGSDNLYQQGYHGPQDVPYAQNPSYQPPPPPPDYQQTYQQQQYQQQTYQQQPNQHNYQGPPPWLLVPKWVWWVVIIVLLSGGFGTPFAGSGAGDAFSGIFFVLAIVIIWLFYSRRLRLNLSGETSPPETHVFQVNTQPRVVIDNLAGSIRLHTGGEGQVSITTTR